MKEKEVYSRGGKHGFFRDLAAAAGAPIRHVSPSAAEERLAQHAEQQAPKIAERYAVAARCLEMYGVESHAGTQERAMSAGVLADGGVGVPPDWMVSEWATIARAAAPLRGLVTKIDLPEKTLELYIPRFESSAGVLPAEVENTEPPEDFGTTGQLMQKVATFTGDALLSQQLYDRGGSFADHVLLSEFAEAYAEALQGQLIAGTGSNGQLLGLLNVPNANVVTYTSASPTPAGVVEHAAMAAAAVSNSRDRSPSALLMRGSRYYWTVGTPDSSGEPEQRPGTGRVPSNADTGPYGPIASLPVYHDNTIPTDVGGEGRDAVIALRAQDILLLEDPAGPRFTAYLGATVAGQMTVVVTWHTYAAAFTERYPSAIGIVAGSGLAIPAGFGG